MVANDAANQQILRQFICFNLLLSLKLRNNVFYCENFKFGATALNLGLQCHCKLPRLPDGLLDEAEFIGNQ